MPKFPVPNSASVFLPEPSDLYCHILTTKPQPQIGTILVTGGSGYVGGRLIPELTARGYDVRVMVRKASPEHADLWPDSEIVVADALDPASLDPALRGVHTAYYLIHSLYLGPGKFATIDVEAAVNFRHAAERCGVQRIIYLCGLGNEDGPLSDHLKNRMRVAHELTGSRVAVTVLRAAIIMGSGSASYEIIQSIVRRLPVIPSPPWARNRCQPIAIRDVIRYLVGVLEVPETAGKTFDIGGQDVLTYQAMIEELSRILVRKKIFFPWPRNSISLCAYLASFVTPVPAPLIRCLFDSLNTHVVCENNSIRDYVPFQPLAYREMVIRAISREEQDRVYTRWTDAYPPAHELAIRLSEIKHRPKYIVSYSLPTVRSAAALHRSYSAVGGKKGWFHNNWMWRLRGIMDRVLMGVGTSRGRRSMGGLKVNDVIDFWRVEDIQPDRRLLLRAEMKLPGRAWLEFSIAPENQAGNKTNAILSGQARKIVPISSRAKTRNILSVTAYFDTRGLAGITYWYMFLPFHRLIFVRLLQQIVARSTELTAPPQAAIASNGIDVLQSGK